jgi:hypothetical protein
MYKEMRAKRKEVFDLGDSIKFTPTSSIGIVFKDENGKVEIPLKEALEFLIKNYQVKSN